MSPSERPIRERSPRPSLANRSERADRVRNAINRAIESDPQVRARFDEERVSGDPEALIERIIERYETEETDVSRDPNAARVRMLVDDERADDGRTR